MTNILDTTKNRYCPLCLKKWKIVEESGKNGKAYFVCFDCEISIWVRDPLLGAWEKEEKIPCTVCGNGMHLFFRSDHSMKCKCPKCGATVETYDEAKHGKVNPKAQAKDIL